MTAIPGDSPAAATANQDKEAEIRINRLFNSPVAIIILLRNNQISWDISKLARTAKLSYVHTTHLLSQMKTWGWVKTELQGRRKIVSLTDGGLLVAKSLHDSVMAVTGATTPG